MKHKGGLLIVLAILAQPLRAQNILLVSVDTLRADRLSCYGYRRNSTPAIDRWAREGIRFEHAYSEYPLTLPAHSTLLTGTLPIRHGVRENVGFVLAGRELTLAELLAGNGYATGAFIGSFVLASRFGISQGFGTFDEEFGVPFEKAVSATALRRPAEAVAGRYLAWAERHRADKTFAFVHFYDPHAPCPEGYDAEVSRVDRAIGRIHSALQRWNLLDKTLVVLLSDHGESLGEHGESGHGFFLYDSTLRVPLILRFAAGFRAARKLVPEPVSLVDVMPTILGIAGIGSPAHLQGKNLVPFMNAKPAAERGLYAETWVPQLQFGWSPLRSIRLGRHTFIDAPRPELYDVVGDPDQKLNLFRRDEALSKRYAALLTDFVAGNQPRTAGTAETGATREVREKLAALGYVRPGGASRRAGFGRGVDPKDRIAVYENYHETLNDITAGRITQNVFSRIASIRNQAPELTGVPFLEAQALEGIGRLQEAGAAYRRGLEAEPGNNVARAGLAGLLMRLGKTEDAEREFRRVLAGDPGDYRSRNNLAGVYATKGFTDLAVTELKKALATEPSYAAGWQNLGRLYTLKGSWPEAEAALRKAVSLYESDARAHLLLAQVLRRVGKTAEAERHSRRARELDPGAVPR